LVLLVASSYSFSEGKSFIERRSKISERYYSQSAETLNCSTRIGFWKKLEDEVCTRMETGFELIRNGNKQVRIVF